MDVRQTFDAIAARAAARIQENPGDYEEAGLLYCGKCGTPKETVVEIGGEAIKVRCLCRCQTRRREAEGAELLRKQQEQMRREWVRGFENMTFAGDNGRNPAMAFARKFADAFPDMLSNGVSVTLSGGIGCGKTYAAASIANAVLDKGYRVWMVTAPDLVEAMGFETSEKARNRLRRFELVVIDDLSAERGTEYAVEKIFEAVDLRQKSGLPTIITTNLDMTAPPPDLNYRRIYSRVAGFAPQFRVKGADMRTSDGAEKRKLLRELMDSGPPETTEKAGAG